MCLARVSVISNDVGWRDYLMSLVHSNNVTIHATTTFDLGVAGGLQWRSRQQEFVNERIITWQLTKRERASVGVLWKCWAAHAHHHLYGQRLAHGSDVWHCTLQLNLLRVLRTTPKIQTTASMIWDSRSSAYFTAYNVRDYLLTTQRVHKIFPITAVVASRIRDTRCQSHNWAANCVEYVC